ACAFCDLSGTPVDATESEAVAGFMHLVQYRESRQQLMSVPPSLPQDFVPDERTARPLIEAALREHRGDGYAWLDPIAIGKVLAAYGVAITPASLARDPRVRAAAA